MSNDSSEVNWVTWSIPKDLSKAVTNLASSMKITIDVAMRQVIERGLTGLADDRGKG
jgi:hypothetical protein